MKTVFHSSNLVYVKGYTVLAFCAFIGAVISLWIHPERFGFVFATVLGFISSLLLFSTFIFTQNAESMVNNYITLGKFTSEVTVISFKVQEKVLVSLELFNGFIIDQIHFVGSNSGINVYEVPGVYYIVHEVSDLPFAPENTVRVYKK